MKSVLVLVFSNLKYDARVMRQVNWLRQRYRVTVVCFDADEMPDVSVVRIRQTQLHPLRKALLAILLLFRSFVRAYHVFHNYGHLKSKLVQNFDLVVANDIDALPLAFQLRGSAPVIFDAHEYAPRHFENNKVWQFFFQPFYTQLCKEFIPKTTAMLTVGEGLANAYHESFGVKPVIITNAGPYAEIGPIHPAPDRIRLVHHGIINSSRRLELMVEMMANLDTRFSLDMILMTSDYASARSKRYIESFKQYAGRDPRITILPAVRPAEIVNTINKYDIGVFLIPPVNFNYANTLPNKFFDFIQARLAIAVGPTPEMAAIVNKFNNGIVAEDFNPESLAAKLNELTAESLLSLKLNSSKAARVMNAEMNAEIFNNLLDSIEGPNSGSESD